MKANLGRTEPDAWDAFRKEESEPRSADIVLSLCPNILFSALNWEHHDAVGWANQCRDRVGTECPESGSSFVA
jgi:hypothetical protein